MSPLLWTSARKIRQDLKLAIRLIAICTHTSFVEYESQSMKWRLKFNRYTREISGCKASFWGNCQRNIVLEFKLWEVLGYSPFEFCFSVRILFRNFWNFTHKMRWNWILWYNNWLYFQYQIVNLTVHHQMLVLMLNYQILGTSHNNDFSPSSFVLVLFIFSL